MRLLASDDGPPRLVRERLSLAIDVLDDGHAMLEAWIERPDHRGTILHRQPVKCAVLRNERFLHLDAIVDDGACWLRLSVQSERVADPVRPVFAQTSLLEQAGFVAGAFDPPAMQWIVREAMATA